ncbi:MAG: hypothetical protein AAFX99_32160, partial [Myxococcota bacterium]
TGWTPICPRMTTALCISTASMTFTSRVDKRREFNRRNRAIHQGEITMPTIRLAVPPKVWTRDAKKKIVERLTAALAEVAKEEGKGDITPYIGVQIDETAEGGYAIGGNVFG